MIRKDTILGIFDMDNATWSRWTRDLLHQAEQADEIVNAASDEIPNAFVLCEEQGRQRVYLSMLTAATLRNRALENGLS